METSHQQRKAAATTKRQPPAETRAVIRMGEPWLVGRGELGGECDGGQGRLGSGGRCNVRSTYGVDWSPKCYDLFHSRTLANEQGRSPGSEEDGQK